MRRICSIAAFLAFLGCSLTVGVEAQQPPTSPGKNAPAVRAASLEGEWSGTLEVGETQLHLILRLAKNAQGEWRAIVDSLDQAVYGMEAANVARVEDTVRFELSSVGAKFQGKISPDHKTIRGVWEQGGSGLPLRFEKSTASTDTKNSSSAISKIEGTWQGAIETGNMRMRLQLHISHDQAGGLIASVDSLDQSIQGIPASRVSEKGSDIKLELPAFDAEYTGTVNTAKNSIAGTWSQSGNTEKLDFRRSERILELRRPQNPAKPYPYKVEEVSFAAADGKANLAATLTLPQSNAPFPAVLLVGGSGPNDRDETTAGHKTFLVLSDFLTRRGIAVLRYDKRGIAQSTGNYAAATLEDFAQDAQLVFAYLKSRKEVDTKRLGIIGYSEGGILGALVATRSTDVSWLVLMGTPVTTGERTLLRQSELIARAGGLPEEQITRSLEFDRNAYAVVREEKNPEAMEKRLNVLVEQSGLSQAMSPAALQAQIRVMSSPWFRDFLIYDPEPVLEKLQCPVLALSGDRDLQVDSTENVPLLRKAYETSGNKDFTVVEIEGVNHLFQTAQSGSPALYGAIEETMAPSVLAVVRNWIVKHTSH